MSSLFDPSAQKAILDRLGRLEPTSARQWGKMDAAQMLTHCAIAMEMATGDSPRKQKLIGVLLAPFFKSKLLGEEPFSKSSPTDPAFVITDARDFAKEKQRLLAVVDRFCKRGPSQAETSVHSFLGKLTGDEWGRMMYKHLDHHLRQFGC